MITGFLIHCCLPLLLKAGLATHTHTLFSHPPILNMWGLLCLVWSTCAWVASNMAKTHLIYWGSVLPRDSSYKIASKGNASKPTRGWVLTTKPYFTTYPLGLKTFAWKRGMARAAGRKGLAASPAGGPQHSASLLGQSYGFWTSLCGSVLSPSPPQDIIKQGGFKVRDEYAKL